MARILIVDDSPSQLVGLKRIVEKLGHQVVTAEDGSAGVEAAFQKSVTAKFGWPMIGITCGDMSSDRITDRP